MAGASGAGGVDSLDPIDADAPDADAGDEYDEQRPCSITAGDHEQASCASGACPIVTDVLFDCPDSEFAAPGLRVAALEEQALLFTTATSRAFVLSAHVGEGMMERLPASMKRTVLQLAQTQDGEVVLSSDTRTGNHFDGTEEGGIVIARRGLDGWVEELVPVPPHASSREHDFEIDASGAIHQWFQAGSRDVPEGFRHARRSDDGTWLIEDTAPAHPEGYYPRWTLGRTGDPIGFSYALDEVEGITQLVATIDGVDVPLGSSYDATSYPRVWPLAPAVPATTADAPPAAAVLDAGYELRIVWPSTESYYFEEPVPDTHTQRSTCHGQVPPCTAECVDRFDNRAGFAATQTSDGRLWIVWSETHNDITYRYEEVSPAELPGEVCISHVVRDDTTATLHVSSFDFATRELVERLALPMQPIAETPSWSSGTPEARRLDARAFGDQLAIGVRVSDSAVRLLQLDTSSF